MYPRVFRHRLQYASNFQISGMIKLHPTSYLKPVEGAELALLGNIGRPNPELANFLKWCEYEFPRIYWIPGTLELSSASDDKMDIMKRPQILRDWLTKQRIERVSVFTKTSRDIHIPPLRLLGTSLTGSNLDCNSNKLYTWQNGKLQPLTPNTAKHIQNEETEWLVRNIQRSVYPCICMTTNEISIKPSRIFNNKTVVAQVFGQTQDGKAVSFTGKNTVDSPWTGVNVFGASGYNPRAFVEISAKESEASAMESHILEHLYDSPKPAPRRFRPGPDMM